MMIAFFVLGMSAKAQIENLDEVELLGQWEFVSGDGIFTGRLPIYNNSYRKPVGFTFNDNTYSIVKWEYVEQSYAYQQYGGYWVSHTSDKYILHLLSNESYLSGEKGDVTMLNFVVSKFSNGEMVLQTLSGDGSMLLKKQTPSSISAITAENEKESKAYTINGIEATDTTKGIIIQNGKKTIRQ